MGISLYSEIKMNNDCEDSKSNHKHFKDLTEILEMLEVVPLKREYILENIKNAYDCGYRLHPISIIDIYDSGLFMTIDDMIIYLDDNQFNCNDFYLKLLMTIKSGINLHKND